MKRIVSQKVFDSVSNSSPSSLLEIKDHEGSIIRFFPVTSRDGLNLGISENGHWFVSGANRTFPVNGRSHVAPLLPFLKNTISALLIKLKNNKEVAEHYSDIVACFPFKEIVKIGFNQKSQYWAELAFDWYTSLEEEDKLDLQDTLREIVDSKWADQKFRHKVRNSVKRK